MSNSGNVSKTINSYLLLLVEQMRFYAIERIFGGREAFLSARICMDAQVPLILEGQYLCALVTLVSTEEKPKELLSFEITYEPGVLLRGSPGRRAELIDLIAYQVINGLVEKLKSKGPVTFHRLEASTGLKPDRQRYYL